MSKLHHSSVESMVCARS
ncbi:hypothetical protein LINPERPRIM_LOCUS4824 [Linum perenne]